MQPTVMHLANKVALVIKTSLALKKVGLGFILKHHLQTKFFPQILSPDIAAYIIWYVQGIQIPTLGHGLAYIWLYMEYMFYPDLRTVCAACVLRSFNNKKMFSPDSYIQATA